MNIILKTMAVGALFFTPVMVENSYAQTQVTGANGQITLNASLDSSSYSGFVSNGTFTMTFAYNNSSVPVLEAGKFRILAILPPNLHFSPSYTPPAGWNYELLSPSDARFTPTANVTNVFGQNAWQFQVPVTTVGAINNESFTAYLQPVGPWYSFVNVTNPEGTVSVQNVPLPVVFKDVTATAEGCKVVLNWKTAIEKNNSHFVIERSNNSTSYTAIGRTNGAGTSYELNSYTYVDEKPAANHNFYRIRQVDFDGASTTSEVVNAKVNCDNTGISIYPNPANNAVYVKGLTDKSTIEVYNVVGQKVVSKIAENTLEAVNLSGLAEGVYQVQVVTAGEIVYSTKLIKK
jgi:hypothetical protein